MLSPPLTLESRLLFMRLLSYNIHKAIGGRDRRYDLKRVISVIEHENPDLICLQEVDRGVARSHHDDQPKLLAQHFLCEAHCYQLNVHLRQGGYGNLVLSRWPIVCHHHVSLKHTWKKPRGAQIVTIDTPEGRMLLVNWHLGLAERERNWQVRHLLGHHLFTEGASLPAIVAGDFNDWRNTLADGPFAPFGFRHVTGPPSRFRSFPAYLPVGSLDKAFIRGDVFIHEARIVRSPTARSASDHLPLVVDFHLKEDRLPARPHGAGR